MASEMYLILSDSSKIWRRNSDLDIPILESESEFTNSDSVWNVIVSRWDSELVVAQWYGAAVSRERLEFDSRLRYVSLFY